MNTLDVGSLIVGALGVLWGVRCYVELWRWAKQCQRAKIGIAYKRRVQLDAPLVEWLGWANQLGRDEARRGRVVYRNHGVSVVILRGLKSPSRLGFIRARFRRKSAQTAPRKVA